jgi:hypothetical protein
VGTELHTFSPTFIQDPLMQTCLSVDARRALDDRIDQLGTRKYDLEDEFLNIMYGGITGHDTKLSALCSELERVDALLSSAFRERWDDDMAQEL